mgnify:CR=1 FL=1
MVEATLAVHAPSSSEAVKSLPSRQSCTAHDGCFAKRLFMTRDMMALASAMSFTRKMSPPVTWHSSTRPPFRSAEEEEEEDEEFASSCP